MTSIKKFPFFSFKEILHPGYPKGPRNEEFVLKEFTHNNLMKDLLGVESVRLHDKLEGFNMLSLLRSKDWVLFFDIWLNFKISECSDTLVHPNALHLETFKNTILTGYFSLFKEVYIEKSCLVCETYLVFMKSD